VLGDDAGMTRELRLPIALWAVGSAALVLLSLQYESAIIVSGLYVGLNGASLLAAIFREPPYSPTALTVMAWCTAAQLPTMLVLIYDGSGKRPNPWNDDPDD
jgi:hypothetical protein